MNHSNSLPIQPLILSFNRILISLSWLLLMSSNRISRISSTIFIQFQQRFEAFVQTFHTFSSVLSLVHYIFFSLSNAPSFNVSIVFYNGCCLSCMSVGLTVILSELLTTAPIVENWMRNNPSLRWWWSVVLGELGNHLLFVSDSRTAMVMDFRWKLIRKYSIARYVLPFQIKFIKFFGMNSFSNFSIKKKIKLVSA